MSRTAAFATRAARMKASEIRDLLKLLDRPDILSFAGGIPDPALFPAEKFAAAMHRGLTGGAADRSLQYGPSAGVLPLRTWIAGHMGSLGVPCGADNVLITSGAQQALDYLGKLYLSPGDTALVGWPTYLGALGAFNAYEPCYDRLDPGDNRTPDAIAAAARAAGGAVKFAYLSPDFANPTGRSYSRADREALLDRAEALGCAVIEDGAYQALRYSGDPVPPVLALEYARTSDIEACRTLYCGTFSKTLAPGLRVGWVCGARRVIARLDLIKQAGDLQSATLNQIAVADVAADGFDAHVDGLRRVYAERRDAMLAALAAHMPEGVRWTRPEGGMFVWLTLPEAMDGAALLERAIAQARVAFVPGSAFFPDGSGKNTLRLSFSRTPPEQIAEGMARLGRLIAARG